MILKDPFSRKQIIYSQQVLHFVKTIGLPFTLNWKHLIKGLF